MSAAATAAGYLYASGRLRGRGAREQEHGPEETKPRREAPESERPAGAPPRRGLRKPVRVAALPEPEAPAAEREKRAPRIQYRVRRWRPEQGPDEGHERSE
jgi:hypothetical protein